MGAPGKPPGAASSGAGAPALSVAVSARSIVSRVRDRRAISTINVQGPAFVT
jgi:hypothetical protein